MPGGLPDCLTAPRPGSLALTPLQLVLLLSSALPLRSRYLPRNIRLPRTTAPDLSCLRAPFHPFGYRLPAILLPRPVLSPTFVSSFSSPLASTTPSFSLRLLLAPSLSLSPRYTISHACICHLVPDTPRLADPGRLTLSFFISLSLPLPLLAIARQCPSRSLVAAISHACSSLSRTSRVRNSHRFAYVRYRGRTSLHLPPLGRPTPLQRRPRRPSYVHAPILALSLGRARTHHAHPPPCSSFFLFPSSPEGPRPVHYLLIIVRLFPLTFVALTIVMRCLLILADVPLFVFSGEYSQNSNVLIFSVPPLFSFFVEGYALIRRHLNPLATRCRRYMCYVEKSFPRFESSVCSYR